MFRFTDHRCKWRDDQQGATVVEFALILPVFLMILLGAMDMGMMLYGKQVLQGAVSQAARSSTLEGYVDDQAALDKMVGDMVKMVLTNAELTFDRQAYETFDDVGMPEEIISDNGNGIADPGECFWDVNGTKKWEADRGRAGNGGAEDVVRYVVTAKFDRIFPFWSLMGQPQRTSLSATSILRNQPYGTATSTNEKICIPHL